MVGAGLLPVALHKGIVYLLFGRENELNDTPGWADFGGGTKPKESLLDAAAREGSEELNGLLGSQSQLKKIAIKKKITELKYDAYTTIVFKTHYDDRLEDYYLNNYKFFEKYLPSVKKNPGNGLLEKAEIKWFTFAELRKNKTNFRKFYQHMVDVILANEDIITKNLMKMKCGANGSVSTPRKSGRVHTKTSSSKRMTTCRRSPSRNNRRLSRKKIYRK